MHTNIHKYIGYICYICNHFTRRVVSSCNWIWLWVCRKCANVCGAESMRVCQLCVYSMYVCVCASESWLVWDCVWVFAAWLGLLICDTIGHICWRSSKANWSCRESSVKRDAEGARATSLAFHWDLVSHIGSVINYGGKQAAWRCISPSLSYCIAICQYRKSFIMPAQTGKQLTQLPPLPRFPTVILPLPALPAPPTNA